MKRRDLLFGAAAGGLALLTSFSARAAKPNRKRLAFDETGPRMAIVAAIVHTGAGKPLKDAVIELEGTRIVRVEAGGKPSAGAEVAISDAKVVTTGFIAPQTRLGLVEIGAEESTRDASRPGEHPVRAAFDVGPAIHAESSLIQVAAVEGVTTSIVAPGGGLISGRSAVIDLVHGNHTGMVSIPRVAMDATLGQVGGSRAATLARFREVLADAEFYRRNKAAFNRRQSRKLSAHPLDLEALAPVLAGQMPLTIHAHRASDILALLDLARELGLKVVVEGGAQAWKVADALARAKVPVILQPSQNLPGRLEMLGSTLENAARLHAAGVTVAIGVAGEAHNVRNIKQEAGIAVANGLPHEAAMAAITSNVAAIYGIQDHYGTLAPGQVANLAVWDGDPLELSSWPKQVFIRGQAIPMKSRQTMLRERYRDLSRFRP